MDNGLLSVVATDTDDQSLTFLAYLWTISCLGATFTNNDTAFPSLIIAAGTEPTICNITVRVYDACDAGNTKSGMVSLSFASFNYTI